MLLLLLMACSQSSEPDTKNALPVDYTQIHPDSLTSSELLKRVYLHFEKQESQEAQKIFELAEKRFIGTDKRQHPGYDTIMHLKGYFCYSRHEWKNAIEAYKEAIQIRRKMHGSEHPELLKSMSNLSSCYGKIGNYEEAIDLIEEVQKVQLKKYSDNDFKIARTYDDLGIWTRNKGNWREAIHRHEMAMERLSKLPQDTATMILKANIYNNLAMCYEAKGDKRKTINLFQKALDLRQKWGEDSLQIAVSLENIGLHMSDLGQSQEAIKKVREALKIRRLRNNPDTVTSIQNICYCFEGADNLEEAQKYCQLALNLRVNQADNNHDKIGVSYNNLANIYFKKKNYSKAEELYSKALEHWLKTSASQNPRLILIYRNLGACKKELGILGADQSILNKALALFEKALIANNSKGKKMAHSYSIPLLIYIWQEIGATYFAQYQIDQKLPVLRKAHEAFQKAEDAIRFQRQRLDHFARQQFYGSDPEEKLDQQVLATFEGNITTAFELYTKTDSSKYLRSAFTSSENAKSRSLFEAMKHSEALQFAGIPESIIAKEQKLRIDIAYYEKRLHEMENTDSITAEDLRKVRESLFYREEEWVKLLSTLEIDYPNYHRLKYDVSTIQLDSVQDNLLNSNQVLLEYFVGNEYIYIFIIKNDFFDLVQVKKDFNLSEYVKSMREGIFEHFVSDSDWKLVKDQYIHYSRILYGKIFAPIQQFLPDAKRLVIIPDAALCYLPFDALLSKNPNPQESFASFEYLLKKFPIGYSYSATLLHEMEQKQHIPKPPKLFLGMAPYFPGDGSDSTVLKSIDYPFKVKGFPKLEYNKKEVKVIQQLIGGKVYSGRRAKEETFCEVAKDFNIIHLSTHGLANDLSGDFSLLAFTYINDDKENELLFNKELYNLQLRAEMVVLSACETGIGEWRQGEGVISLARGFSYAGAKSIVTSLWQVREISTSKLMNYLYQYLKDHNTKDVAMWKAKKELLNGNEFSHPFYWASFVPFGDMKSIQFKN